MQALRITVCTLGFVLAGAGSALAADDLYAPGTSPFAGFYAGAYAGYGATAYEGEIDRSEFPDREFSEIFYDRFADGATYGGYFGYNVVTGNLLYGLEADLGSAHHEGKAIEIAADDEYATHKVELAASLRARFGALTGERTLVYGTAGLAYVRSDFHAYNDQDDPDADDGGKSLDSYSYVVGAGMEHMLTETLSLRFEGLYSGKMNRHTFEEDEFTHDMDEGDFAFIDGSFQFRVGVAYHF